MLVSFCFILLQYCTNHHLGGCLRVSLSLRIMRCLGLFLLFAMAAFWIMFQCLQKYDLWSQVNCQSTNFHIAVFIFKALPHINSFSGLVHCQESQQKRAGKFNQLLSSVVRNFLDYTSKPGKQLGHNDLSIKDFHKVWDANRCFRKKKLSGQIHLEDIVEMKQIYLEEHPEGFNNILIYSEFLREIGERYYMLYFLSSFNHKTPISLISHGTCNLQTILW